MKIYIERRVDFQSRTCPVFFTIRIASLINGAKFVGPAMRTRGVILLYASNTPRKLLQYVPSGYSIEKKKPHKFPINHSNDKHTRRGKIFRSSVVRSPKPKAGINVSESYFSNVRPTIVMT